jgi:hypothetical protein
MMVSSYYVERQARRLLALYGDGALARAQRQIAQCQMRNEAFAADTWIRIVDVLEQLLAEGQRSKE